MWCSTKNKPREVSYHNILWHHISNLLQNLGKTDWTRSNLGSIWCEAGCCTTFKHYGSFCDPDGNRKRLRLNKKNLEKHFKKRCVQGPVCLSVCVQQLLGGVQEQSGYTHPELPGRCRSWWPPQWWTQGLRPVPEEWQRPEWETFVLPSLTSLCCWCLNLQLTATPTAPASLIRLRSQPCSSLSCRSLFCGLNSPVPEPAPSPTHLKHLYWLWFLQNPPVCAQVLPVSDWSTLSQCPKHQRPGTPRPRFLSPIISLDRLVTSESDSGLMWS